MSRYTGNRRWKGQVVLAVLAGLCLLAGLLCFTVLPGARFSAYRFWGIAGLILVGMALNRWAENARVGVICRRIFLAMVSVGIVTFAAVEGVILFHGQQENAALPADAVIVLGAGVNGETPSLILQSRIETAAEYLKAHPETPAILSGGKGAGEDITEAECMRRELVKRGIPESRLYLEEDSTRTAENFSCSKALLSELGLDPGTAELAVVTSDFHCFRAHLIAQREGLTTFDLPAKAPWLWLNANYYAREFFALGKTLLFD